MAAGCGAGSRATAAEMWKSVAERDGEPRRAGADVEQRGAGGGEAAGETGQEPELGNGLPGPHPGHDALRLDDGLIRVRPALDRDGAGRGVASKLLGLEQGGPQGGPEGRGARPGGEGNERGRRRDALAVLDDEAKAREKTDEGSHGRSGRPVRSASSATPEGRSRASISPVSAQAERAFAVHTAVSMRSRSAQDLVRMAAGPRGPSRIRPGPKPDAIPAVREEGIGVPQHDGLPEVDGQGGLPSRWQPCPGSSDSTRPADPRRDGTASGSRRPFPEEVSPE